MPLTYLLYRCPACGYDPLTGAKDTAQCLECGTRFTRGREGARIRVEDPGGETWEVPAGRLTARLEAFLEEEWAQGASTTSGGPLPRTAGVQVRQSGVEAPVRWGGELLGFAEAMGEFRSGTLELGEEYVSLEVLGDVPTGETSRARPGSEMEGSATRWPLLDIRAVQTSSSSLQFSPRSGGLVEVRFPQDSPYRWEGLLREALRRAYRREGLGTIVEFQPRVVAE